jgi:hypothetical protein
MLVGTKIEKIMLTYFFRYMWWYCVSLVTLVSWPLLVSRFARAGGAFIVFEARHARVSRFSKPAPPAARAGKATAMENCL